MKRTMGIGEQDAASRKILVHLRYVEERSENFTLFYKGVYTGIQVVRSHGGYNHFAKWYMKEGGKVRMDFESKEREAALQAGMAYWQGKLADRILKQAGRD